MRIDRTLNTIENAIMDASAIPGVGLTRSAIGVVQLTTAVAVEAFAKAASLIGINTHNLQHQAWEHIKHGTANIGLGIVLAIPVIGWLAGHARHHDATADWNPDRNTDIVQKNAPHLGMKYSTERNLYPYHSLQNEDFSIEPAQECNQKEFFRFMYQHILDQLKERRNQSDNPTNPCDLELAKTLIHTPDMHSLISDLGEIHQTFPYTYEYSLPKYGRRPEQEEKYLAELKEFCKRRQEELHALLLQGKPEQACGEIPDRQNTTLQQLERTAKELIDHQDTQLQQLEQKYPLEIITPPSLDTLRVPEKQTLFEQSIDQTLDARAEVLTRLGINLTALKGFCKNELSEYINP